MKKQLIFFIIITSLSSLALRAQEDAGIGLQIGFNANSWYGKDAKHFEDPFRSLKIGYNMVDQSLTRNAEYIDINSGIKEVIGFHAGIEVNSELTPYIWMKHEFLFYTKGFSYSGVMRDASGADIGSARLNYRSYHVDVIPVAIDFHAVYLQVFAGPYFSVLIDNEWRITKEGKKSFDGVSVYDIQYKDIVYGAEENESLGLKQHERYVSSNLNSLDIGMMFGAEYEFAHNTNVSFFYKYGLTSLIETPKGQDKAHIFNRSFNLAIGYTFAE